MQTSEDLGEISRVILKTSEVFTRLFFFSVSL